MLLQEFTTYPINQGVLMAFLVGWIEQEIIKKEKEKETKYCRVQTNPILHTNYPLNVDMSNLT